MLNRAAKFGGGLSGSLDAHDLDVGGRLGEDDLDISRFLRGELEASGQVSANAINANDPEQTCLDSHAVPVERGENTATRRRGFAENPTCNGVFLGKRHALN